MTLGELEILIRDARSAKDLFGPDPATAYRAMSMVCHPDRNPGNPKAEALFKELHHLHELLKEPIIKLKLKKHEYTMLNRIAVGDVSDVWIAEADGKNYIVKVSRVPEGAAMLDHERTVVADLLTKAKDTTYRRYFPTSERDGTNCNPHGGFGMLVLSRKTREVVVIWDNH